MLKWISRKVKALHSDEQGADMVEYVLIIAAVALPLLAVIIWYWHDFVQWSQQAWEKIKGGGETNPADITHN